MPPNILLKPSPKLEGVFSLFAFSSSYVEDVIDKKKEFENVREVFAEDSDALSEAEASLRAIENAPELAPLTKEERHMAGSRTSPPSPSMQRPKPEATCSGPRSAPLSNFLTSSTSTAKPVRPESRNLAKRPLRKTIHRSCRTWTSCEKDNFSLACRGSACYNLKCCSGKY